MGNPETKWSTGENRARHSWGLVPSSPSLPPYFPPARHSGAAKICFKPQQFLLRLLLPNPNTGEPMRNVARLKTGYYPLPESEGRKLRALLSFSQQASGSDPCVGQGPALHLVTGDAEVRRYGVELDSERARIATSKGIETIQGNAFDAIAKSESFSLLYLNPPYDSEIGSVANNRMERLFLEHTYRWLVPERVLVLIIPFERLHDRSEE